MTQANTILHDAMIDTNFLNKQLNILIQKQVDFADLYLQHSIFESWMLDEGIVKTGNYDVTQGVGLRAISNESSFLNYSNEISERSIQALVNNLFINNAENPTAFIQNKNTPQNYYTDENPSIPPEEIVNMLQLIDKLGRSYSGVTNVIASISNEYSKIYIARSDEHHASDTRPLIRMSITLIVTKEKTEKGSSGGGGRYNLSYFTDEIIKKYIEDSYSQVLSKLDARPCPSGQMPVILSNGWSGILLHEAIGHGLEGDFNRKGSSAFSNRIGQKVASDGVTVVDNGTIENRRGSLNIDDEGNATQNNTLIEDGILVGYMFDALNAKLMNCKSTGNGRRESFAALPMPRMTNTYMLNGKYSQEEIIASVERGIYAEHFEGGQVDITSGQFVFNASVAWLIEDGKLSYPVKGCALVGNGPECLKHISMIGNDMKLDDGVGTCGKNGQSVPVGVGQPSIRIDGGLVVGGSEA